MAASKAVSDRFFDSATIKAQNAIKRIFFVQVSDEHCGTQSAIPQTSTWPPPTH
jgi:hypothetical protein